MQTCTRPPTYRLPRPSLTRHVAALPRALFGRAERRGLRRRLRALPEELPRRLYVERTLGATDLELRLELARGCAGRQLLARAPGLARGAYATPEWRRARGLARGPHPWLSLCLCEGEAPRAAVSPTRPGLAGALDALAALGPRLTTPAGLLRCLKRTAGDLRRLEVDGETVRLQLGFRRLVDVRRALDAVDWPGCFYARDGFALLPEEADGFVLHLEVDSDVRRRIAVEPRYYGAPGKDPRLATVLGRMRRAGLCSEAEAQGLLDFAGYRRGGLCGAAGIRLEIDGGLRLRALLELTPERLTARLAG